MIQFTNTKISDDHLTFQAQMADFAYTSRMEGCDDRADEIYDNLTKWQSVPNHVFPSFRDFLSAREGKQAEQIHARRRFLGEYAAKYSGFIERDLEMFHFNTGSEAYVYKINDKMLKIRYEPLNEIFNLSESIDQSIMDGWRAENEPNFEQLRGASYNDSAIVTDFVRGKTLDEITREDLDDLLRKRGRDIVKLAEHAVELKLSQDLIKGNIMFHETDGFTIIDYKRGYALPKWLIDATLPRL